jgi:hypothetical protein
VKKFKHIIVTRLGLKGRYAELGLTFDQWLKNSVSLMNKYCRASLRNQTNQDFTLLSLIDRSISLDTVGELLDNEVLIPIITKTGKKFRIISKTGTKEVLIPPHPTRNRLSGYINTLLNNYEKVIMTRLDRDDCLGSDYVEKVQQFLKNRNNYYVDTSNVIILDEKKQQFHNSPLTIGESYISPFVSTIESLSKTNPLNPLKYVVYETTKHGNVSKMFKGEKLDLPTLQVIHGQNISNGVWGIKTEFPPKEMFGIEFIPRKMFC